MKLKGRNVPFWAWKNEGKDKGVYRVIEASAKDGVIVDLYISGFSLYYGTSAGFIEKRKHFGYSTFQHFKEINKLNNDLKKSLLRVVLENYK